MVLFASRTWSSPFSGVELLEFSSGPVGWETFESPVQSIYKSYTQFTCCWPKDNISSNPLASVWCHLISSRRADFTSFVGSFPLHRPWADMAFSKLYLKMGRGISKINNSEFKNLVISDHLMIKWWVYFAILSHLSPSNPFKELCETDLDLKMGRNVSGWIPVWIYCSSKVLIMHGFDMDDL